MNDLPEISIQSQNIEPIRLPTNSYRFRAAQFGRFQLFDLINDSDVWENNQLNWISLFLIKTFGINNINVQTKEQAISELNDQIKNLQDKIKQIEKLETNEQLNQLLEKELTIEKRLSNIEKSLENINKRLNPIDLTSKTVSEISRSLK